MYSIGKYLLPAHCDRIEAHCGLVAKAESAGQASSGRYMPDMIDMHEW